MGLNYTPIGGQEVSAMGHESITVAATAIGFTSGTITPATGRPASRAFVTAETAQMRYTYDGTTPTSSIGHLLDVGDILVIEGIINVQDFLAIRTTGTSGNIRATFDRFK